MCDICTELTPEERAALPPGKRVRHGLTPRPEVPTTTTPPKEDDRGDS